MLVDPGRDREDVRVEDDVLRVGAVGDEQLVGALADLDLALGGVGLADLVERHDDDGGAIGPALARELEEQAFAFLHRDRIDDRLARHALQAGLDHAPFGAVDHHRNARDVGLGGDALQERRHRLLAVEQCLVDVDVDDLRAVLDLVARDLDRRVIVAGEDQLLEPRGSGDVAALADVDEARAAPAVHLGKLHFRQRSASARGRRAGWRLRAVGTARGVQSRPPRQLRRCAAGSFRSSRRRCSRARSSTHSRTCRRGLLRAPRHTRRARWEAGVGIGHDQRVGDRGQRGEMRPQLRRAERAIEPDGDRLGVATDAQKASTVWPERLRPERSVSVIEIISGSSRPSACSASSVAMIAALALSVSNTVSIRMKSTPPSTSASDLLAIDGLHLVEIDFAKAGSLTFGDSDSVLLVGPSAPATQRGLPSLAVYRSATSRMISRGARLMWPTSSSAA